eukprot:TRINITY_DN2317_c0_g1_i1.p1 TRINITY_DN2317_c0_g1~~TRINITY_DN2317_c0_g1_i1.p1  ORF type:complete len:661 (-),score=169.57 TRINITY_DN2317_c0_g1_i1:44-2026(-)
MLSIEVLTALLVGTIIAFFFFRKISKDASKKNTNSTRDAVDLTVSGNDDLIVDAIDDDEEERVHILYGSQKGTALRYANMLQAMTVEKLGLKSFVCALDDYDPDLLVESNNYVIFIVSTYTDGTPPDNAKKFYLWLEDSKNDHRVQRNLLLGLKYCIFGCGNAEYKENFNFVSRKMHRFLRNLRATPLVPIGIGNEQEDMDKQFEQWSRNMWRSLKKDYEDQLAIEQGLKEKEENLYYGDDSSSSEDGDDEMMDMEDLGANMVPIDYANVPLEELTQEMVTPRVRKSLTKQGYKILGSHSGVKLCRWTKSMLRGRGGCYKHTFYGITSYQCMEMTPSLACANKCVFCWRHHSNPVGTQWKWKVDNPEFLVDSAVENHFKMINTMKGVPGVVPERFIEGTTKVKHCALSLVGEPIIYPHINEFLDLLHERDISTFLVTNAQFPDRMQDLRPVTQLYVSIDAGTPESLKEIDRPLFSDFWERFLGSIDVLAEKGQRTVFRLTLVKEWNMQEITNYATLIRRGRPDFIEVKGVTYCGKSDASSLNITNTPFHQEVINFCKALNEEILNQSENNDIIYDIASEHEHSLCVLLADKNRFYVDEQWHTWINYPKFHELINSGESFTSEEYMEPTPYWAVYGAEERGFDPEETRYKRNKKKAPTGGC